MKISCWALTTAGRRTENQDAVSLPGAGLLPDDTPAFISIELLVNPLLVAVADGVGGRPDGRWAARIALSTLGAERLIENSPQAIAEGIRRANHALSNWRGAGAGPATTLAGLAASQEALTLFHIGDSRIYEVGDTVVRLLTRDHRSRTDGRSITRYLGSNAHAIPTIITVPIISASTYLISSDGFYDFLRETDLLLVGELEPAFALNALFSMALENGSDDNLSAIIVKFE